MNKYIVFLIAMLLSIGSSYLLIEYAYILFFIFPPITFVVFMPSKIQNKKWILLGAVAGYIAAVIAFIWFISLDVGRDYFITLDMAKELAMVELH